MDISNQKFNMGKIIEINSLIGSICEKLNVEAYLVGGFTRDCIIGIPIKDIDIVVSDKPKEIVEIVSKQLSGTYFLINSDHAIYRINVQLGSSSLNIDIGLFEESIYDDLFNRDFTINAIALKLDSKFRNVEVDNVIDPYCGVEDIKNKIIKTVNERSFIGDPLRLLRCIRLYAELNFEIDKQTVQFLKSNVRKINDVSWERIREEVFKILSLPNTHDYLELLDEVGLLGELIPEMEAMRNVLQPKEHHWDVFEHSINSAVMAGKMVGNTKEIDFVWKNIPQFPQIDTFFKEKISDGQTRLTFLKFTALLHDIGKPDTRTIDSSGKIRFLTHSEVGSNIANDIMSRLRISNKGIGIVKTMIENHLRPAQMSQSGELPTDKAIYRYFRDVGDVAIDTLYLDLSDYLGMRGPDLTEEEWVEHCTRTDYIIKRNVLIQKRQQKKDSVLLNGDEIMEKFDLCPGPKIGSLIAKIKEAQAMGHIKSRDEALIFVESNIN